jgi:hypothetical protein
MRQGGGAGATSLEHMADNLERTDVYQQHHNFVTGQVPVTKSEPDPFADDTPLACGLENPDECEACS